MTGRDQAYAYSLKARGDLGAMSPESHVVKRTVFLRKLIRRASELLGVGDLRERLAGEVCDGLDGHLKAQVYSFEEHEGSGGIPEVPFDIRSDIALIGWCYQAWNQPVRDTNSWAVSYKSNEQHELAQVSVITQLFTDDYLADFIVDRCLTVLMQELKPSTGNPTICDPACGVGHMLLAAIKRVCRRNTCHEWLPGSIFGFDIDVSTVALARVLVFLQVIACGYSGDREGLLGSLRQTIKVLPEPFGTLERTSMRGLTRESFDVVITNPPYLGRRKLSAEMRGFLDREYPAGKVDLCAAFMQRCIELCASGGLLGLVTTDKWLRLRGYEALRDGLGTFQGILGELSIDLVCELGARAFHQTTALHDGVRAAILCARKTPPSAEHTFELWNLDRCSSYREKVHALHSSEEPKTDAVRTTLVKQDEWKTRGSASMLLQASELPKVLLASQQTVSSCADVVVGIQTNDDSRFVRYAWQVPPEQCGWRVHVKGGGYTRWFGLNRWVIQWDEGRSSFFKTEDAQGRAEGWIRRAGWSYSWFANGALGLRVREATWSVGRAAASAIFCEDSRVVAFLNSRFASVASRATGGKIQLPEGVVRALPIPPSLDEISPELVEVAVDLKAALVRGDLLDVFFDPSLTRDLIVDLALEALLLMIEGILELQVEQALKMSTSEVENWAYRYGQPVGLLAPTEQVLSHPMWNFVPEEFSFIRMLLNKYTRSLPAPTMNQKSRVAEVRTLKTLAMTRAYSRTYALPTTGIVEHISRLLMIHPFDVVYELAIVIRDRLSIRRDVCLPKLCTAVTSDILMLLGHRWWRQPNNFLTTELSHVDEHTLCTIVERRLADTSFLGIIEQPYARWIRKFYIPWQQKRFFGCSPLHFHEDSASGMHCRHEWASKRQSHPVQSLPYALQAE